MEDSPFVLFIAFGLLWTLMGGAGVIALLKADGQEIRIGKWGLLVAVPILLPIVAALIVGVVLMPR